MIEGINLELGNVLYCRKLHILREKASMNDILTILIRISIPVFVISSMIGLGLSLTVKQIVEPLRDARLVIAALLANFVLVPLFVYGVATVLPISQDQRTALIILSLTAGAPFLPKLTSVAKGNVPFSIGLMLLLMVVTIFYTPLVLPLFFRTAEIHPLAIAKSLVIMLLLPLVLALFVRARAVAAAEKAQPHFARLATISLVVLTVGLVALHLKSILAMVGLPLVAMLLFLGGAMLLGFPLGGSSYGTKKVLALGTGQRNIAAAILVAVKNKNLGDQQEIIITMVAFAVIGLLVVMSCAKWMSGKFAGEQ